jgi:hypothetical protein
MRMRGQNSRDKGTAMGIMRVRTRMTAPAPASATVSNCSQGGKQVLMDNNELCSTTN